MTPSTVTAQSIATIKSQLQQMVNTLQTANTYQQALSLWQQENGNLTEDEINQVMGASGPVAADPFGGQSESVLDPTLDPFQ
ncbi:hypothetical protein SPB21_03595 [Leptothoe sp. ISB3NOV94-8A]